VNTKNNKGVTPMMSVAIKGIFEFVMILVEISTEINAAINAAAKDGFTALMYGAYYGHTEIVAYLLNQDADKSTVTKKGETALSIAEKKTFGAVAALLK
jgi:ankyrin repeat protein